MGGPSTTNNCFSPSSSTGTVTYTWSNVKFTVQLTASCPSESTATASYSIVLQGDLYDLTTASWAFGTTHLNTVLTQNPSTVTCTSFGPHTYTFPPTPPPTIVTGKSTTLSTTDTYWFFVDLVIEVSASATGQGT
ncbi:MAG TPA: hypothetical protein VFF67_06190, partial [Thermoplasmata archaeon]|nr:hypothetical protein [Thermoplasmata archaeon]